MRLHALDKEEAEPESVATEGPSRMLPLRRFLEMLLQLRAFASLRHREYRLLLSGQVFVSMGQWMDEVTRGWLIYELTDSAVQLGLVRGIQAVPYLFLSPVAGSVADRYSRKAQLVVAQVVNGFVYAITAFLIITGEIRPWHVYVTAFVMAVVQTFQQPARASMVADAVPANFLTNAIGLNATVHNVSRSVGPAVAGMLIVLLGTGGTYIVQALFFFLATFWTVQLRAPRLALAGAGDRGGHGESFGRSIIEGWKFSWENEVVRTGLLVLFVASLFIVPFTTLLPVFARDLLGVGASGQGFLITAMGIGALCSAVLIASAGERLPRGMLMLGSVIVYGFTLMIIASSTWFSLSLVMMTVAGLCHVHSHALVQTLVQAYSPPSFRGRTMSLFHMSRVITMTGSMFTGAMAALLGARWAMALMGAVGMATMIFIYLSQPRARLIR